MTEQVVVHSKLLCTLVVVDIMTFNFDAQGAKVEFVCFGC